MHIANRGFIVPIQIPLSFDFLSANSVRFIPVKFCATYSTDHEMNCCNSFEFTPATLTILLSQPRNVSDRIANSNRFNIGYIADDFK